ncbi:hypothetical protein BT63DRAFT_449243 [Microthyrium microscopicum]|uniref:Uncharacterized protein n=1 Tax=Microthyrium microscopicum TaxID=703497 RepID=A0A6A6UR60_9PEZI|nr:hypothetical protein BT63DRAFT_449243 [Microthyrium microscopicum]
MKFLLDYTLLCFLVTCISSSPLERRADDDCDVTANENALLDGPTSDIEAGIGVEFESGSVMLEPVNCPAFDARTQMCVELKGKIIDHGQGVSDQGSGSTWELTGDTTFEACLSAEYILNGKVLKLGKDMVVTAAKEAAADFLSWKPSVNSPPTIKVEGSDCDWKITAPDDPDNAPNIKWSPQITAPLPLEAIQAIFQKANSKQSSNLLSKNSPNKGMAYVTKDFFQAKPGGISPDTVTNDVLGFFSLLLSYAKVAGRIKDFEITSPKQALNIMPRSDFSTLYQQVKSSLLSKDLYSIVGILACYTYDIDTQSVNIDAAYCSGDLSSPQSNQQFDKIIFYSSEPPNPNRNTLEFTIKDWLDSIVDDAVATDLLTTFDATYYDNSIGFLANAIENVIGTARAVPLFEFRYLPGIKTTEFSTTVDEVEKELVGYHTAFQKSPSIQKRGLSWYNAASWLKRRQNANTACNATINPEEPAQISNSAGLSSSIISESPLTTGTGESTTTQSSEASSGVVFSTLEPEISSKSPGNSNNVIATSTIIPGAETISPAVESLPQTTQQASLVTTSIQAVAGTTALTKSGSAAASKLLRRDTTAAPTTTNSTSPSATSTPICSLQNQDPDEGVYTQHCICGTVTAPLIFIPTANVTAATQSCDYTTMPTPKPTYAEPNTVPYPYTITKAQGEVVECQSLGTSTGPGFITSLCLGTTAIISTATPIITQKLAVQVGQDPVYVGTLSSTAVYTSVSSILESLCPSLTGSSTGACATPTGKIDTEYIDTTDWDPASLEIRVETSYYKTSAEREAMIQSAAASFAAGLKTAGNCQSVNYKHDCFIGFCSKRTNVDNVCSSTSFTGVQSFDGMQEGPSGYMDVEFALDVHASKFDCAGTLGTIDAAMEIITPLLGPLAPVGEIIDAILGVAEVACQIKEG